MEFIVASADKLQNIVRLKERLPTIKTVIIMDQQNIKAADKEAAAQANLAVHGFQDVEKLGQDVQEEQEGRTEAKPEDIATICYTRYLIISSSNPKWMMTMMNNLFLFFFQRHDWCSQGSCDNTCQLRRFYLRGCCRWRSRQLCSRRSHGRVHFISPTGSRLWTCCSRSSCLQRCCYWLLPGK